MTGDGLENLVVGDLVVGDLVVQGGLEGFGWPTASLPSVQLVQDLLGPS